MKLTKTKVIWLVLIISALILSYIYGGNYNTTETRNEENTKTEAVVNNEEPILDKTEETQGEQKKEIEKETGKKEPEVKETLKEETPEENFCTLMIRCDTILSNMNLLNDKKHQIVPENGIILAKTKVSFNEGESVFNVLRRETKRNKIHLEFSNTPIYNSVYIEGIANLYEFDVGELSGWVYKVNGISPGYASSEYTLNSGDEIEWLYTCDLGKDVNATVQISK